MGRHIIDSIQILNHLPKEKNSFLLDVGTGAGFPGVVLAIMGRHVLFYVKKAQKNQIFEKCTKRTFS